MENLLKLLNKELKKVTAESFYAVNRKKQVVYPYLTYDFDTTRLESSVDGIYIDIDIFDNKSSYLDIVRLEERLKEHLHNQVKLIDGSHVRFYWRGSNKVPTLDENIKRRQSTYQLRVINIS